MLMECDDVTMRWMLELWKNVLVWIVVVVVAVWSKMWRKWMMIWEEENHFVLMVYAMGLWNDYDDYFQTILWVVS
jgi:ABC-type proline/glycine betaine transport system permease subunit